MTDAPGPLPYSDEFALRRAEKLSARHDAQNGPLEPAQRYRALWATLKSETDLLDLADKKARFALVVMGVLNALVVVLALKGKDFMPVKGTWGSIGQVETGIYALCAVYYVWQAIEALRPRGKAHRPPEAAPPAIVPGASMRVIFHGDIARRSREEYRQLWRELRLDNLITELADQVHMVSTINVSKYDALGRLYRGLGVMTVLVLGMVLTIAAYHWIH
jgi:hypothetical protein